MTLHTGTEHQVLTAMLDVQREQVSALLDGLEDSEARVRLVPSLTTPLGLVKHATFVERVWFHSRVAGIPRASLGIPETIDESFVLEPEDTVDSVRADYITACTRSREIVKEHELDDEFPWHDGPVSLRFVLTHLIAELARHAGHGDILREQLLAQKAT